MQKIALHSLVRLVSALSTTELLKTLEMLVDMDMVPMLILCAKLGRLCLFNCILLLLTTYNNLYHQTTSNYPHGLYSSSMNSW